LDLVRIRVAELKVPAPPDDPFERNATGRITRLNGSGTNWVRENERRWGRSMVTLRLAQAFSALDENTARGLVRRALEEYRTL
jgi:hypothetical protein